MRPPMPGKRLLSVKLRLAAIIAGLLSALAAPAAAQLVTEDLSGPLSPVNLVQMLVGEGVSVSNVAYTGADVAAGRFSGGAGIIGFDSGIILGSGDIALVVGPNDSLSETGFNFTPGDADLDAIVSPYSTNDAAVLEFDFVPRGNTVNFEYVFASEEYPNFVGSSFNDVFAFFVNDVNYALVADDQGNLYPVAINTINDNPAVGPPSLAVYYVNNHPYTTPPYGPLNTEMNGLTVVLTLTAPVNPGVVNRMKLAIADTSDSVLDSNVFIRAGSLTSFSDSPRRVQLSIPGTP